MGFVWLSRVYCCSSYLVLEASPHVYLLSLSLHTDGRRDSQKFGKPALAARYQLRLNPNLLPLSSHAITMKRDLLSKGEKNGANVCTYACCACTLMCVHVFRHVCSYQTRVCVPGEHMFVIRRTRVCVCSACTCVFTCAQMCVPRVRICVFTCAHMCVPTGHGTHVCYQMNTCVCLLRVHMYVCSFVHTCVFHVYTYVCSRVHTMLDTRLCFR